MDKRMEFCPKCNGIRKMVLSLGLIPSISAEDPNVILVYNYHCASCNSYVGSFSMDHQDFIFPDEDMVLPMNAYA